MNIVRGAGNRSFLWHSSMCLWVSSCRMHSQQVSWNENSTQRKSLWQQHKTMRASPALLHQIRKRLQSVSRVHYEGREENHRFHVIGTKAESFLSSHRLVDARDKNKPTWKSTPVKEGLGLLCLQYIPGTQAAVGTQWMSTTCWVDVSHFRGRNEFFCLLKIILKRSTKINYHVRDYSCHTHI